MNLTETAVLALAFTLAGCDRNGPATLHGYMEGEYVRVAAPFAGTLLALEVRRGDRLEAGAPLFALEAENEQAARREAEDHLKRAEARVADLRKGLRPSEIAAVRAQLAEAESAAALSRKALARQEDLVSRGFASRQTLDEARAARDRDASRVSRLRAELATATAGSRPDEIRAAEAEASAAREALAQTDWRLRQKSVHATVSGEVADTLFTVGEWVPAGAPVVSILPPQNVKARFFVPEPQVATIRVGQGVSLACDGCEAPVAATVTFVAPQAEFTPPVIYSKESRAKLVFLVEAVPRAGEAVRLRPGQPVDVTLQ